jgi:hypothetical protein
MFPLLGWGIGWPSTAMEFDLTVLPLSAAVEITGTRGALRRMLSNLGEPYLVIRLGVGDPEHARPPHTPRLPADQVVEVAGRPAAG